MGLIRQRSGAITVAVSIVLGAAAIAFARPRPTSEPLLGTEWQCNRAAFVVTCNHRSNASSGSAPAGSRAVVSAPRITICALPRDSNL
jgi:hypothetical protein